MPNKNYLSGRRFEYARKREWEKKGYQVTRAAGSHSSWDLIAVASERPVELIQTKKTKSVAHAKKLLADFKAKPPLTPSKYFHQVLEVRVTGQRDVESATV